MSATVPATRPAASSQSIAFGRPVRGFDWLSAAGLANYVRGRGAVIIPQTEIGETVAAGPNTRTYHFRCFTNVFTTRRVYLIELQAATVGTSVSCTVSLNGGASTTITPPASLAQVVPYPLYEDVHASADLAEHEITVAVTSTASAAVKVLSIQCVEIPVAEIASGLQGQELGRVAPTAPIDINSIGIVASDTAGSAYGAINAGRRAGMHHYIAGGSEGTGVTTTSTVLVPVYTAGCEAPMLGRYLYSGDTLRALAWKAYGKITGGATLTVTVTMTSGDSQSVTTTSAAGTWFGGPASLNVDAEDLTVSDGRRSSRFDVAAISFKSSSGAQTATLYSVSFWEPKAV